MHRRLMVSSQWTGRCRVGRDGVCPPPSWVSSRLELPSHGSESTPTKHISDKGEAGLGCLFMSDTDDGKLPPVLTWDMATVDQYQTLLGSGMDLPKDWNVTSFDLGLIPDEAEQETAALELVERVMNRRLSARQRLLIRGAVRGQVTWPSSGRAQIFVFGSAQNHKFSGSSQACCVRLDILNQSEMTDVLVLTWIIFPQTGSKSGVSHPKTKEDTASHQTGSIASSGREGFCSTSILHAELTSVWEEAG